MEDGLTIAVAGITGSGKTTWVRQHLQSEARLILVDTRGEHNWLPAWTPEPGDPTPLASFLSYLQSLRDATSFQVRVVPPGNEEDGQTWVEFIGKQAYFLGNVTVVVEEADVFSNPNWENGGIRILHNYARSRGVTLVYLVRVVNSVNRLLTSNTKAWVLFRLQEPHYLASLDARFDFDVVGEVSALHDLEYIQVNPDRTWEKGTVTP